MPIFNNHFSGIINKILNSGTKYFSLLLVVFSFLFLPKVNAQDVLISWDFSAYVGNETIGTATTVSSYISDISPSGKIQRGLGLTASNNANRFNGKKWGLSDLATAITDEDYMEWTIEPELGYKITITSLEFNYQKSSTGPSLLTIRSSSDGYASDLDTKILTANTNNSLIATISGVTNVTSPLSFRLYGYGASSSVGSGGFEGPGDDIIIYGTVSELRDIDSEVNAPGTQVPGASISSTSNTIASASDVFKFAISDQGIADLMATKVTTFRLTPSTSNTADWTDHIQGVTLNNGSPITIGSVDINDTYIDIPIISGNLDIGNNSSLEVTLAVFLNTTTLVDGAILSFLIDASNHGFTADVSGSQFANTFSGGNILSNDFYIDVQASQMQFVQQPSDVMINGIMTPSVTVSFADNNGNIDVDYATEQISISVTGVTLSASSTTPQTVQSNGLATFNDLAFSTFGFGTLIASDATSSLSAPDIVSSSFEVLPVLGVIQAVAGSEPSDVSSIINDVMITSVTEGVQVWQLELFDGDGINPDNDGKPTNYTSLTISQHPSNQISDWQNVILTAGFFEGSVFIPGVVTISQTNVSFTPNSSISVPDGAAHKKTISLRISVQSTLPANTEGSKLVFELTEMGVTVEPAVTSSQLGTFTASSSSTSNAIDIEASKLLFIQQPSGVDQDQIMAPSITVSFTDANGNIDVDYATSLIGVSANNVTLAGGLVNETVMSDGLSTFSTLSFSTAGEGTLTATDINNVLGISESVVSSSFEVIPNADHVAFVNFPTSGQINQVISSFTVEARRPDESVDANYGGDITISVNSGSGDISGALTQPASAGIATFNDIQFDASGVHSLSANSGTLFQGISANIAIAEPGESVFPNGQETMGTTGATTTIANHDAASGFVNSGVLTFNGGGAAKEAVIRFTSSSSGYTDASGGANVYFTSTPGEYGFAIQGIDASSYTNLSLQFAVRKYNVEGAGFATLAAEYWDGDNWKTITISDYPSSTDGSGWYLLSPVSLPAEAEIANLGIRWVKSGNTRCRIDDITLTGTPNNLSWLIVATINGGLPPNVGVPFDVDIEIQDGNGSPSNVLQDTDIELTLNTGSGVLGGTLTTSISTGTSTSTFSGVTYNVSETGIVLTASRTSGDDLESGNSNAFSVLPTEPTTSASSIHIDAITLTSMNLSWTVGDGTGRIVIAKQGAAVDQSLIDVTTYAANADFTLGEDIGNGNIVVFAGAGNSVSITNLQPKSIAYHFAIYEYNGAGSLENYKQSNPAIASEFTASCNEPLVQATELTFSNIAQSSLELSWTDGDGDGRIVFMNSTNTFVDPVNGVDSYVADPGWNNAGQQVVYFSSGAGASTSITNLSIATTYYFREYEYNCTGAIIKYKTDVDNTTGAKTNSFTIGYPKSNSPRFDGFHVYANTAESLTAYYLIKNTGDPVPNGPSDVVGGIGGVSNSNIVIDTQGFTYTELITGLSSVSGFDIYWVLDNGSSPLVIDAIQNNVRTSDLGADVSAPVSQIASAIIPATTDLFSEAIDVFAFDIKDNSPAGGDAGTTNVSKVWIRNPGATDWAAAISGITLSGNTLGTIPITDIRVYTDSIVADIDPDGLLVPDQGTETITMGVYLLSSGILDGTTLRFEISETNSYQVFETSVYGSQFATPFAASTITSSVHTIDNNLPQGKIVSGKVATYLGEVVENVTVQIVGGDRFENTTDLNGAYSLSVSGDSEYYLSASRIDDQNMNNAVTTVDMIKTRRHILQIQEFSSPYQIVAADVNLSRSVTALDIVQMRKVILGNKEGFSNGLNWLFIPDTYDLSLDPFYFDTHLNISRIDQDLTMDFVAVKIGDVNSSWTNQSAARISKSTIALNLERLELKDGMIEIPLTASNFNEISGYQFSITWDANQLEYQGIEHMALEGHFNENFIEEGILTTLWDEPNGQSIDLENGTVLFALKFLAKDDNANSLVELNSTITQALAFDSQLNTMSINSLAAHVNLEELLNGRMELYQNVPNPFDASTEIGFRIVKEGQAKLSIINLLGETIYTHEQGYKAGVYKITWNKSQSFRPVPPGVYLYRLESKGQKLIRKMVIK